MMSDRLPVTVARELERINREHDLEFDSPALVRDWLCHPDVLVSDLMGKPDARTLGDALVEALSQFADDEAVKAEFMVAEIDRLLALNDEDYYDGEAA
jgi:hypothetical protein